MVNTYMLSHYRDRFYIEKNKRDFISSFPGCPWGFCLSDTVGDAIAAYCEHNKIEPLRVALSPNEYFVFSLLCDKERKVGRIEEITRLDQIEDPVKAE